MNNFVSEKQRKKVMSELNQNNGVRNNSVEVDISIPTSQPQNKMVSRRWKPAKFWNDLERESKIEVSKDGIASVNGKSVHPSFHKSGSIRGMRERYYGKSAHLIKFGNYIYNVSSLVYNKDDPEEMLALKFDHFKDDRARKDLREAGLLE